LRSAAPNQALHLTGAARRLFVTCSSPSRPGPPASCACGYPRRFAPRRLVSERSPDYEGSTKAEEVKASVARANVTFERIADSRALAAPVAVEHPRDDPTRRLLQFRRAAALVLQDRAQVWGERRIRPPPVTRQTPPCRGRSGYGPPARSRAQRPVGPVLLTDARHPAEKGVASPHAPALQPSHGRRPRPGSSPPTRHARGRLPGVPCF
jgi:hypothetical protein